MKNRRRRHRTSTTTTGSSVASTASLSWEAQELRAKIRGLADSWITQVGHVRQHQPSKIQPHERSHYLDHPEHFPEVELEAPPATLSGEAQQQATRIAQRARLNRTMLEQMFHISDDLGISEDVALALMVRVVSLSESSSSPTPSPSSDGGGMVPACKRLWVDEQRIPLATLLRFVQYRLESDEMVAVTDPLLDRVMPKLMHGIQQHTARIREIRKQVEQHEAAAAATATTTPATASLLTPSHHHHHHLGTSPSKIVAAQARFHTHFHSAQRQILCETLFYLSYHAQWKPDEACQLLDLVRDLSNQLPVLDPFHDVPDPLRTSTATVTVVPGGDEHLRNPPYYPWASPAAGQQHPQASSIQAAKDELEWQRELVEMVGETDLPNLLKCLSVLVVSAFCVLDATSTLIDRTTHLPNEFGTVRAPSRARGEVNSPLARAASIFVLRVGILSHGVLSFIYRAFIPPLNG
jgi:hypothetical protein